MYLFGNAMVILDNHSLLISHGYYPFRLETKSAEVVWERSLLKKVKTKFKKTGRRIVHGHEVK
jgi:hypothetical protein